MTISFELENYVVAIPRASETIEHTLYLLSNQPSANVYHTDKGFLVAQFDTVAECSGFPIRSPFSGKIHSFGISGWSGQIGPTVQTWHRDAVTDEGARARLEQLTLVRIRPNKPGFVNVTNSSTFTAYREIFARLGDGFDSTDKRTLKLNGLKKDQIAERQDRVKQDLDNLKRAVVRSEPLTPSPLER